MRHILLMLLSTLLLSSCQTDSDSWPRIEREGVLRVGLDPTYPPFEVDEGGGLRGLDVDLAEAIGRRLNLTISYTYLGYDGLYDGLATGQVDVLLSALVIQLEKTRDFAYSDPYFDAGQMLLTANESVVAMDDLAGRSLAVELGADGHVQALAWSKRLPDLTIIPYNTPDEALAAAESGAAAAVLIDSISSGLYLRANSSRLAYTAPAITSEPFALVVRIEDKELLARLNTALSEMNERGELAELTGRWLTVP